MASKCFWTQIFFGSNFFSTQNIFGPNNFFDQFLFYWIFFTIFYQKFVWTKILFDKKYIWTNNFSETIVLELKFFISNICLPKIFWTKIGFTKIFFDQIFLDQKIFWLKDLGNTHFLDYSFSDQKVFAQITFHQNLYYPIFFGNSKLKILWLKFFWAQKSFWVKNYFVPKKMWPRIIWITNFIRAEKSLTQFFSNFMLVLEDQSCCEPKMFWSLNFLNSRIILEPKEVKVLFFLSF